MQEAIYLIVDPDTQSAEALRAVLLETDRATKVLIAKDAAAISALASKRQLVAALFIPAKIWDFFLVAPLLYYQPYPKLVLLAAAKERYVRELFQLFPDTLQAPYNIHQTGYILESVRSRKRAVLQDWHFLLLKINFRYHKIAFGDITRIERAVNIITISTRQEVQYQTFIPLKQLQRLLPKDKFIRLKKGLILPVDKIDLVKNELTIDDSTQSVKGSTMKKALKEFAKERFSAGSIKRFAPFS